MRCQARICNSPLRFPKEKEMHCIPFLEYKRTVLLALAMKAGECQYTRFVFSKTLPFPFAGQTLLMLRKGCCKRRPYTFPAFCFYMPTMELGDMFDNG
jgi:hypothetical protein